MVRLRYPRRGADNSSLPGHTLRRGPEGHDKAARDGRHLAGSVNHGANMPAHGSSARSASAVSEKRSRICCSCSMISSAVASLIARLRPTRSFLKSVFSPRWGCQAHRRAGICIYDACVGKCVAVLGQAVPAEPPSLPEWALMWDDELLERIPSTSATNIEAGRRDRVRELRDRGMSWARIGAAPGTTRQLA
jgi:hypothetical protein